MTNSNSNNETPVIKSNSSGIGYLVYLIVGTLLLASQNIMNFFSGRTILACVLLYGVGLGVAIYQNTKNQDGAPAWGRVIISTIMYIAVTPVALTRALPQDIPVPNITLAVGIFIGVYSGVWTGIFLLMRKSASETSKPVEENTIGTSSSHTGMNVRSSEAEPVDFATKQCPKCAETIKLEAIVCRFCGYEFNKNEVAEEIVREETQAKERKEYHELQSLIVKKRDTLKSLTRASRFYSGMAMFIWVVGGILFAFTTIVAFVELDVWIFLFYLSLFLLLFAAPATLLSRAASRKKKKISDLEEEILDLTAKCTKNESVEINNRGQTTII